MMPWSLTLLPVLAAVSSVVRSDKQPDLTMRQLTLLLALYRKGPQTKWSVKEAAAFLETSKSAVTRVTERLREHKLITARQDPADRRCVILNISPAGEAYLKHIAKHTDDAMKKLDG